MRWLVFFALVALVQAEGKALRRNHHLQPQLEEETSGEPTRRTLADKLSMPSVGVGAVAGTVAGLAAGGSFASSLSLGALGALGGSHIAPPLRPNSLDPVGAGIGTLAGMGAHLVATAASKDEAAGNTLGSRVLAGAVGGLAGRYMYQPDQPAAETPAEPEKHRPKSPVHRTPRRARDEDTPAEVATESESDDGEPEANSGDGEAVQQRHAKGHHEAARVDEAQKRRGNEVGGDEDSGSEGSVGGDDEGRREPGEDGGGKPLHRHAGKLSDPRDRRVAKHNAQVENGDMALVSSETSDGEGSDGEVSDGEDREGEADTKAGKGGKVVQVQANGADAKGGKGGKVAEVQANEGGNGTDADPLSRLQVVIFDPEGNTNLVELPLRQAKAHGGAGVHVTVGGDMFDPKEGHNMRALLERVGREMDAGRLTLVVGNRDLNKLRFILELSPAFQGFLKQFGAGEQANPDLIDYMTLRLFYWTFQAMRETQRRFVQGQDGKESLGGVLMKALAANPDDDSGYVDFAAAETMGCAPKFGCKYTNQQFGFHEGGSLAENLHSFFSSRDGLFHRLISQGRAMALLPHGCEGKACTMLVAHSGLCDAMMVDPRKYGDPDSKVVVTDTDLMFNPYAKYGGVVHAVAQLNEALRESIEEAFATTPELQFEAFKRQLKREWKDVKADFEKDKGALNTVIKELTVEGRLTTTDVSDAAPALRYFHVPLEGRGGSVAMDASLPFPARSPLPHGRMPSLTTNNPLNFYRDLQYAESGEGYAHLCDLANSGIRSVVLGHINLPGPLVLRFPATVITAKCASIDVVVDSGAADVVVMFVDQSGYATPREGSALPGLTEAKVSFAYAYQHKDVAGLRFGASSVAEDQPVFDVDVQDAKCGLALPHDLSGVPEKVRPAVSAAAGQHKVVYAMPLAPVEGVPGNADSKWWALHATKDIGAPFLGNNFSLVELTEEEDTALRASLRVPSDD